MDFPIYPLFEISTIILTKNGDCGKNQKDSREDYFVSHN